jgi:hypothetical protein
MDESEDLKLLCTKCGEIRSFGMFSLHRRSRRYACCKLCEAKAFSCKKDAHFLKGERMNSHIVEEIKLASPQSSEQSIASANTRQCSRCGKYKSLEMFIQDSRRKSGWQSYCLECKAKSSARSKERTEAKRIRRVEELVKRVTLTEEDLPLESLSREKPLRETKGSAKARVHAERKFLSKVMRLWKADRYAILKLNGGTCTKQELDELKAAQNYQCAYCKRQVVLTIDHIFPVSRGGRHEIANIAWACGKCNSNKHDKTPEEWIDRWYLRKK